MKLNAIASQIMDIKLTKSYNKLSKSFECTSFNTSNLWIRKAFEFFLHDHCLLLNQTELWTSTMDPQTFLLQATVRRCFIKILSESFANFPEKTTELELLVIIFQDRVFCRTSPGVYFYLEIFQDSRTDNLFRTSIFFQNYFSDDIMSICNSRKN